MEIELPEGITEKHLTYLDNLRESGVTNMFGAGVYVQRTFDVPSKEANAIVSHWMKTFEARQEDTTESAGAEEDDYAASERDRKRH